MASSRTPTSYDGTPAHGENYGVVRYATTAEVLMGHSKDSVLSPADLPKRVTSGLSAAMVAGAVTITNPAILPTSNIVYSRKTLGTTAGNVSITAQTIGSVTLTSGAATETSTFNYAIFN